MSVTTTTTHPLLTVTAGLLLGCLATSACCAQSTDVPGGSLLGLSLQAYPAGFIPALHVQSPLTNRDMVILFIGFNVTDRRDWGEHEDEEGSGIGAGLSLRHYFSRDRSGFFAGVRNDIWFLNIDWRDTSLLEQGVTDVTVLQPTLQLGYDLDIGERLLLGGSLSVGREFNVRTDGAEVGQGAILLGGLRFSYRLTSTP